MSHFGRSGPPDIKDTYSLLVLNITFRTTADDLFPLFDKYGEVVDVFIPRDRRTGDSRGFAFVRYKHADEAQKAVDKLDGRNVDGRDIRVQFAKYGPNAERVHKGRIVEEKPRTRGRSRSRSPRPSYRDGYPDRNHKRQRRSSRERSGHRRYHDRHHRSRSRSVTPDHHGRSRGKYDDERSRSCSYSSASPVRHSPSPKRNSSPGGTPPKRNSSPGGTPPKRNSSPGGTPKRNSSPGGTPPKRNSSPGGTPPKRNSSPGGTPKRNSSPGDEKNHGEPSPRSPSASP
ncbi:Serine/arginine-rich splicing factor like [Canna indica]|uniref:Serine/arginine-rich splicing factor like n=1 Tax=Canna indica TaxID=4628 RepID=A0AAQ3QB92_9LILI|nr:Serine/arginine-rich splicing factor like [Canna indica]